MIKNKNIKKTCGSAQCSAEASTDQNKNARRAKLVFTVLKFVVFLAILVALPAYIYFFHSDMIASLKSMDDVEALLENNKLFGAFIYLILQIIQITISVIPGNVVQMASGYVYGFGLGYILSLAGTALGSVMTFGIARVLGKDALRLIFGERFDSFIEKVNTKRGFIFISVIYLLPCMPKDLLSYVCGVSDVKLGSFLLLSLTMRTPAMIGCVVLGRMLRTGSYLGLAILGGLIVCITIWSLIRHEKLTQKIDELYQHFSSRT